MFDVIFSYRTNYCSNCHCIVLIIAVLQTLQSKKDGAGIFLMFSYYLEMVEKMRQAAIAFFIDVFMSKMTLTLKITLNFYGKFGTLQVHVHSSFFLE